MRRAVRSAPFSAATDATAALGSTAAADAATTSRLKAQQVRRIFAEDFRFLAFIEVRALAERSHRVRVLGIEVRIVARHEDVVLAELGERPREIPFVRF